MRKMVVRVVYVCAYEGHVECNIRFIVSEHWTVIKFSQNDVPRPVSDVPPPEIVSPPPKGVAPPPGDAIWSGDFGGKVIKIVATRGKILSLKCTKFYFGWGLSPRPRWGSFFLRPPS